MMSASYWQGLAFIVVEVDKNGKVITNKRYITPPRTRGLLESGKFVMVY